MAHMVEFLPSTREIWIEFMNPGVSSCPIQNPDITDIYGMKQQITRWKISVCLCVILTSQINIFLKTILLKEHGMKKHTDNVHPI